MNEELLKGSKKIMFSAPHSVPHFRNGKVKVREINTDFIVKELNKRLRKEDKTGIDDLISALCDKPLDSIRKIKTDSSDEWTITEKRIFALEQQMERT